MKKIVGCAHPFLKGGPRPVEQFQHDGTKNNGVAGVPSEQFYRDNAKSNCVECKGLGMVRYFFTQQDTKDAPCPVCFPNDFEAIKWAKAWRERPD